MRTKWLPVFVVPALLLSALTGRSHTAPDWYSKAVKDVAGTFDPAEAKPGQTVTFKLTVNLNDGYFTYPLHQPEKTASNQVNKIAFPGPAAVIFVGEAADADKLPTKAEPVLGIKAMRFCPGLVAYTRKAVVSPKAATGPIKIALTFSLNVCDATHCYPTKSLPLEAALNVLDGPAVPVAAEYADEVAKALAGK